MSMTKPSAVFALTILAAACTVNLPPETAAGSGSVAGSGGGDTSTSAASAGGMGGNGSSSVGGGGAGGSGGCDPASCPGEDGPCVSRVCQDGVCALSYVGALAAPEPIVGDCATSLCDGQGFPYVKPDPSDFPPGGNCDGINTLCAVYEGPIACPGATPIPSCCIPTAIPEGCVASGFTVPNFCDIWCCQ